MAEPRIASAWRYRCRDCEAASPWDQRLILDPAVGAALAAAHTCTTPPADVRYLIERR